VAAGAPAVTLGSPCLAGRDRYERSTEAWTDNTHADAFTHTVRLADDDLAVEVWAVCTPSPGYDVREAGARVLSGAADPAVAARFAGLGGARMVAGFTRRVQETVGAGPGAGHLVDAAIEVARLARQVARLPASATAGLDTRDARQCWTLDTTGWVDLPNSCFTYSPAGRALFEQRPVTTPMARELYTPPPGARRLFHRRKLLRLVRTGPRLDLFHAMHDNVHGFDVHYEVDLPTGRIVAAHVVTSRLPYRGVCDEPQGRIQSLVGEAVDAGLRRRIQGAVGGETGCAQIYDLTADLLKLLTLT
jgi:hypothetical protein